MSSQAVTYDIDDLKFQFRGIPTRIEGDLANKIYSAIGEFYSCPTELLIVDDMIETYKQKHGFKPKHINIIANKQLRVFSISLS